MEFPEICEENMRKPKIEGYWHFFLQPTLTKKGFSFNPRKHLNLSILATSSDHTNSMEKNKHHPLSGSIPLDHLNTSAESAGYPNNPRDPREILATKSPPVCGWTPFPRSPPATSSLWRLSSWPGPVRKPVGCGAQEAGAPPRKAEPGTLEAVQSLLHLDMARCGPLEQKNRDDDIVTVYNNT